MDFFLLFFLMLYISAFICTVTRDNPVSPRARARPAPHLSLRRYLKKGQHCHIAILCTIEDILRLNGL